MNRQIVKLFGFIVALFAILIGFTSYWSVFDAKALKEKEANKRPLLEQQQIRRGRILAADGTVIARSVAKGHGSDLRYVRRYPEGALFGHPIGYSFVRYGDSEFEQFHNDRLVGNESEFSSILDQLSGRSQEGDDIVTNLDPAAQQDGAGGPRGSRLRRRRRDRTQHRRGRGDGFEQAATTPTGCPYELEQLIDNKIETPLLNRATQGRYPPGSTFKVVTAAAGLQSGTITPETTIDAPGTLEVEGHAAAERLQPELRPDLPRHGADQLGQHLVRPARPAARQRQAVRIRWKSSASTRPRRSTCPKTRSTRAASTANTGR